MDIVQGYMISAESPYFLPCLLIYRYNCKNGVHTAFDKSEMEKIYSCSGPQFIIYIKGLLWFGLGKY